MDVNDIVTLIGSLGFPIVACVGMFTCTIVLLRTLLAHLTTLRARLRSYGKNLKS